MHWLLQPISEPPPLESWLSERELAGYARFRLDKRRGEWLAGRLTAKMLTARCLETDFSEANEGGPPRMVEAFDFRSGVLRRFEIVTAADGAPEILVDGKPGRRSLSISHRGPFAAATLGGNGSPVGCDLELVEPRSREFIEEFFTDFERRFILASDDPSRTAMLVWSAKESVLKVLRTGLRESTHSVVVRCSMLTDDDGWGVFDAKFLPNDRRFSGWWRIDGRVIVTFAFPGTRRPAAALDCASLLAPWSAQACLGLRRGGKPPSMKAQASLRTPKKL